MLTAYFDDSGSHQASPDFVLAGYLAPVPVWESFSVDWASVLEDDPAIPYFKMEQAEGGRKEFKSWDIASRVEKVEKLVTLVRDHNLYEVSFTLPRQAWREYIESLIPAKRVGNPYFFAWSMVMASLGACWELMDLGSEKINVIFDQQTAVLKEVGNLYGMIRKDEHKFIGSLAFDDDKGVEGLQAADMAAWATQRLHAPIPDPPFFTEVLTSIREAPGLRHVATPDLLLALRGKLLEEIATQETGPP